MHRGAGSGGRGLVFEVLPKSALLWIAGYHSGEQLRSYILLSKGREEGWRKADSIQGSSILANCGMLASPHPFILQTESGRMGDYCMPRSFSAVDIGRQ